MELLFVSTQVATAIERKRAAEELRETMQRLKLATDAESIGTWIWEFSDDKLEWDKRLCDWYQIPEAVRKTGLDFSFWRSRVHPDDLKPTEARLREARRLDIPFDHEFRTVWSDGTFRYIYSAAVIEQDASGQPVRMIGINRDITEQKRAKEALQKAHDELEQRVKERTSELTRANELLQAEVQQRRQIEAALRQAKEAAEAASRAKSTFLATMSHELRTPMNAILGFSQLLLRDPTLTVSQQHQLTRINRGGTSLMEILNDILEIVRVESGRVDLTPSTTDLHGLLDNLERMFRLRAQAKHLRFHVERHADLPRGILADEIKLRQVFTNLLSNAVKFTPAGGEIIWRMRSSSEPGGTLRLYGEVEDTGVGISPADLQRLFERFFRTETGKDLAGGIGLGLAISLKYVKLMGGELTASSEIGRGSVFRFDVRVERADEALAVAKSEPQPQVLHLLPGSPACRVLVADDQSDNRDLVADILAPLGFEIRTARDGAEAVAICQDWAPQLAILDLRMPVMDGCEAARRIRADHGSAVRILAMSAYVFAENQQRALDAGADVFMQKPFQVVDLLGRIKQLTGVDYVYGESLAAEAGAESVTSGDTSQVPRELVGQLREATSRANYAQMLALVEQVAVLNASLGDRLRTLVRRFDYEAIQTLLSQEEA